MLLGLWTNWWDDWSLYHKVIFDGINKRIYIADNVTSLDVKIDFYSSWKEWTLLRDNAKFDPAFRTIGGDPIGGGLYAGDIYFLINDWQIVVDKIVKVTGILYHDNPSLNPFIVMPGGGVTSVVSNLAIAYNASGGVGTVSEVANAVWGATNLASYPPNSAGVKLNAVGASTDPWNTDLTPYNTPGTAGKAIKDIITQTDSLETSAATIEGYTDTLETAVGSLQTSIDAINVPSASQIADAVWTRPIEATFTAEEILKIAAAVLAGKVSGAGTGSEVFTGIDGTSIRVISNNDSNGNRTSVIINGT